MKIELIPLNILEAVRQNLGAEDENDTSCDKQIETMTPLQLMEKYSAWHLGDSGWARDFIGGYETLKELCVKSEVDKK